MCGLFFEGRPYVYCFFCLEDSGVRNGAAAGQLKGARLVARGSYKVCGPLCKTLTRALLTEFSSVNIEVPVTGFSFSFVCLR